ncbi:MAG: amino acid carrier protein [Phycisphaerales bacterium]|nr:MAG: amino acid carrier protein [Phycisphaerales bacterium]
MPAIDEFVSELVGWMWSVPLFLLLLGCGLIFSVATKFAQWRILTHGVACIRGHYDRPEDTGHISHFQALSAALSATIGLGNIAGVAVAVSLGGPGAVFWMWVVGLFGMALKFTECTLAVMFRDVRREPDPSARKRMRADAGRHSPGHDAEPPHVPVAETDTGGPHEATRQCPRCGHSLRSQARYCPTCGLTVEGPDGTAEVRGGPMWYIQKALVEPLRARNNAVWIVFKVLAVLFAFSTIVNSFGSGNIFQGWNVQNVLDKNFGIPNYVSASAVSLLVALVIIGGIRRIGQVAAKLVPFMCVVYCLGALTVIGMHVAEVPYYVGLIFKHAFTPLAGEGAFAGTVVWIAFSWGLKRACFSNEAGEGSAAIAHAAARTEEPIREGVVAGIGPFVDTIIICTMSAMVLLMTGAWNRPPVGTVTAVDDGTITVACNHDVPPDLQTAYHSEICKANGASDTAALVVFIEQEPGQAPETASAQLAAIDGSGPDANWENLTSLILKLPDLSAPTAEDVRARHELLDKIKPNMPVHFDMDGAELTRFAFDVRLPGFGKYILTLGVCLFAFSTLISWSYYGEKGAEYLFGPRAVLAYKSLFVIVVFAGMLMPDFPLVVDLSDITVALMVFCNLPALLILSPVVVRAAGSYFRRLDTGQMPRTR